LILKCDGYDLQTICINQESEYKFIGEMLETMRYTYCIDRDKIKSLSFTDSTGFLMYCKSVSDLKKEQEDKDKDAEKIFLEDDITED